ncbi:MAG: glutamate--tRNA ligase, partial [Candidatus Nealsonbacteria bacterium]
RIEDTDLNRSTLEFEKNIVDNLKWLGIEWSEGPDVDGKYGPYRQTERKEIYAKYLKKLLEGKKAYYCFCTEEESEAQKQYHMSMGESPKYSGKCAGLSENETDKMIKEGKPCVIRFRMPAKKVVFEDMIRGKIEFDTGLMGDVVIAKDNNSPLYNLAVTVDDYEMEISHVIRGEEHISNTPKQIMLQEALGFKTPKYAHLPLILGPDKSKMSKRHGSVAVSDYRKLGYLPESMINFMAFLGWNPGDEREIYSMASLQKEFSLDKVQKGGAIFNIKRLEFLNGFYIRQKSSQRLTELCLPYLIEKGLIEKVGDLKILEKTEKLEIFNKENQDFIIKETGEGMPSESLIRIISLYQERLKKMSEIVEFTDFFFKKNLEIEKSMLVWKNMEEKEIKKSLETSEKTLSKIKEADWKMENIEIALLKEAEKLENRGNLLWPLRVALTGKEASAGPFEVAELLGREKTLNRIKEAEKLLK